MKEFGRHLRELTLVEQLIFLYLALPVIVFYLGWLKPMFGIGCAALLAVMLFPRLNKRLPPGVGPHTLPVLATTILLAVFWSSLGGAGHLFYANADWPIRDAVLRDLVVYPWPVNYSTSSDHLMLLRAPLGYYLIPALVGKVVGLRSTDYLLLAWTMAGTSLLFLHFASSCRQVSRLFLTILVFIFFSGLDIIGSLVMHDPVSPTVHLEWWARYFQYSSLTTVLFWVPNHGLPGWLAASLIVKNWRNPRFLPAAFLLMTIIPLWSPLTAIGVLFLFAATFFFHLGRGEWRSLLVPETVIAAIIALPIARYVTLGTGKIESGWVMSEVHSPALFFSLYSLFVGLELAIVPFILAGEIRYKTGQTWLAGSVLFFLLLLPFYYFGGGNDFVMRASIPLLAVLALRTASVLATSLERRSHVLSALILVVLALGAVTPACEIARTLLAPRWQPNLAANLVIVTKGQAFNYFAELRADDLPRVLKKPLVH